MGERSFIVTQSIKKLPAKDKKWALSLNGFKRITDDKPVDITQIPPDDKNLYYKDAPYTTKNYISDSLLPIHPNMLAINKQFVANK